MSEVQGTVENTEKETVKRVSDKDFIRAWQTSNSVAEVVEKTGIKTAGQRAIKLRKRLAAQGVELKKMPRGGGLRITPEKDAELAAFLTELNGESDE